LRAKHSGLESHFQAAFSVRLSATIAFVSDSDTFQSRPEWLLFCGTIFYENDDTRTAAVQSYGAQFSEVRVNEQAGEVRIAGWVGAFVRL
jgi:CO/xanthine dehydrogenase Mo-binding subunit